MPAYHVVEESPWQGGGDKPVVPTTSSSRSLRVQHEALSQLLPTLGFQGAEEAQVQSLCEAGPEQG